MQDLLSYFRGIDPETRLVVFQVLRIAGILLAAWVLQVVAARFIRVFRSYMERRTGGEQPRQRGRLAAHSGRGEQPARCRHLRHRSGGR